MEPPPTPTIRILPTITFPEQQSNKEGCQPLDIWPGMYHSPVTKALWHTRSTILQRIWSPPSQGPFAPLLSRASKESRTHILYNFSEDFILREQYRNAWNQCHMGMILEDLDALAGTVAWKHCSDDDNTTQPILLVTASVDKITVRRPITLDQNMKMSGSVTWVGNSSMEIKMQVNQSAEGVPEGEDTVVLSADFTFVARDSKTRKAASINRLVPQTEDEKRRYEEAEVRDVKRKKKRQQSQMEALSGQKPKVDAEKLNALLAEGRVLCDMPSLADGCSILMKYTRLENVHICQPQQRNVHGRIFGGYLMRCAYEVAFSACYIFAGHKPVFMDVDQIYFHRPVDVGDFLRFKSCVLYTEADKSLGTPQIHVEVVTLVTRPELRTSEVSNTFYFTFTVLANVADKGCVSVRRVLPETEEEALRVLQRYEADHEDEKQ